MTRPDRRQDEQGAVVLLVVAMSVVIFTLAALVVDLGQARVVRREAQAASDSSALAAGTTLYLSGTKHADIPGAVAAAKAYANKNYGITEADWHGCTDPSALVGGSTTRSPVRGGGCGTRGRARRRAARGRARRR